VSGALLAGMGLGASLIMAIGAQNAFVLRHGLLRTYAIPVAATCTLVDWTLIALGALGFGVLVERFPAVMSLAAWGGAAFLGVHGVLAFRSALHPGALRAAARETDGRGLLGVLGATLAVSLLNPHVYLDTVVLLGSVASQYPAAERAAFVVGAGIASAVWFFGLALGARVLAPLFEREVAWRVLDVAIGCIMFWIAFGLVRGQLG